MAEIRVIGLRETDEALRTLPQRIQRNILRSGMRRGAGVLREAARSRIRNRSGELSRSLKVGTRIRGATVISNVSTKVFYAKFVEFGTRPHRIVARRGSLSFGGVARRSVEHPGARPRPFMRPALDAAGPRAVVAVGEQFRARLTKEGINTPYVMLEGDE